MSPSNAHRPEKNFFKIFALLIGVAIVGFAGGLLSHPLLNFFGCYYPRINDPVSIANTYIVFTTIIFVGFSVVLVIIGFIFTEHLSVTKDTHIQHLTNELKNSLVTDSEKAIDVITAILENKDVMTYINDVITKKTEGTADHKSDEEEFKRYFDEAVSHWVKSTASGGEDGKKD